MTYLVMPLLGVSFNKLQEEVSKLDVEIVNVLPNIQTLICVGEESEFKKIVDLGHWSKSEKRYAI